MKKSHVGWVVVCGFVFSVLGGCQEVQAVLEKAANEAEKQNKSSKRTAKKEKKRSKKAKKSKNRASSDGKKPKTATDRVFAGGKTPAGLRGFSCSDGALSCANNDCYEEASDSNNDSESKATPLGFGTKVRGVACKGDWDYFKVKTPLGCRIDAHLTQDISEGDVDLYIYSKQPRSGAWSDRTHAKSESSVEFASYVTRNEGEHLVAVVGVKGSARYTLKVDAVCAKLKCPAGDAFEDEDGDEKPNNILREATSTMDGDTLTGVLCKGDKDYYALNTTSMGVPCNPEAVLTFASSDADAIALRLETTTGPWKGAKISKTSGSIRGHYGQKLGTDPFFRVSRTGGDKALRYTLKLGCVR